MLGFMALTNVTARVGLNAAIKLSADAMLNRIVGCESLFCRAGMCLYVFYKSRPMFDVVVFVIEIY